MNPLVHLGDIHQVKIGRMCFKSYIQEQQIDFLKQIDADDESEVHALGIRLVDTCIKPPNLILTNHD